MASASDADDGSKNVKVKVNVGGYEMVIPCGNGNQNMKWLACVVAQRFKLMAQANGRARQREFRRTPAGSFTPTCVTETEGGQVVFPSVKVKDAVLGGATQLKVDLKRAEGAEEDGAATQSTWAALAFNFSEPGRRRAEVKRKADVAAAKVQEAKEREVEAMKMQQAMDDMGRILAVDLDSAEQVEHALARDWNYIRLDRVTSNSSEISRLKRLLLTHFVGLSDLFKYYSGSSSRGSVASMNKLEFQHVLLVCRVCDVSREKKIIEQVFRDANRGRSTEVDSDELALSRFEFFEALMHLANIKFSLDRATGDRCSPSQSFDKLIQGHLLPRIAKMGVGALRQAMRSHTVTKYMSDRLPQLRHVFEKYSSMASDQGLPDNRDTVNLLEFCQLLKDSKMLRDIERTHSSDGGADKNHEITMTEAREVFAAVQLDEAGPVSSAALSDPMQELVFSEYLEAIARVGMAKYSDSKEMDNETKIKRAIDAVVALDKTHTKRQAKAQFGPEKPRPSSRSGAGAGAGGGAGAGAGAGAGTFVKSFITEG